MKTIINEEISRMQELAGIDMRDAEVSAAESMASDMKNSGAGYEDVVAAIQDRHPDVNAQMIADQTFGAVKEEAKAASPIPDNVARFAKKKGITKEVNTVAKWASKIGKRIVGGTAIGKNYDTLILDLTHHGSEVYIDANTLEIEVIGTPVENYEQFVNALQSKES